MKYIVYVSQSKKPFTKDELAELLTHSRARNQTDDITGLLIYRYNPDFGRGNFLQVLQGPEKALEDLWKRISADPRHHTIIVLEEGDSPDRMFADWSMGFRNVDESDLKAFPGFQQLGSDDFWQRVTANPLPGALDMLRGFYEAA